MGFVVYFSPTRQTDTLRMDTEAGEALPYPTQRMNHQIMEPSMDFQADMPM